MRLLRQSKTFNLILLSQAALVNAFLPRAPATVRVASTTTVPPKTTLVALGLGNLFGFGGTDPDPSPHRRSGSNMNNNNNNNNDEHQEEDATDRELRGLEDSRASFEVLFRETTTAMNHDARTADGQAILDRENYLMTSTSRHRRQLEMELLASLADSDDAIGELVHLWLTERDGHAAEHLMSMEEECSAGLQVEEARLRVMISEYPGWAEPYARLALVLYYKGRTRESYVMAQKSLDLKPWHFEVIQLMVLLSLRDQNHANAMRWARKGLPKIHPKKKEDSRRRIWVNNALEKASLQWAEAERITALVQGENLEVSEKVWQ